MTVRQSAGRRQLEKFLGCRNDPRKARADARKGKTRATPFHKPIFRYGTTARPGKPTRPAEAGTQVPRRALLVRSPDPVEARPPGISLDRGRKTAAGGISRSNRRHRI